MEQDRLRQRAAAEWEWYDRQHRLWIKQQLQRLWNPYTETVSEPGKSRWKAQRQPTSL